MAAYDQLGREDPLNFKPGSSSPERTGLDNISSPPWSDATCPHSLTDTMIIF